MVIKTAPIDPPPHHRVRPGRQLATVAAMPEPIAEERHQSRVQEALGLEPTGRSSPRLNLRLTEREVEFLDAYRGQVSRNDFIRLLLRAADRLA